MIHYQLRCDEGHDFEGWFRDSAGFSDQAGRGLLSCPRCGSVKVDRALMAPSVWTSRKPARETLGRETSGREAPAREAGSRPEAANAVMLPDELRAALQRLRTDIERQCDDVGDGFADAARRLHDQKAVAGEPHRGIYGQATEPEREALAEEGIEIMRIPWLPRAES